MTQLHLNRRERGKLLRRLREERGFSLSALARAAGVSKGSLHKVERGKADMTIDRLCAVMAPLKLPPGSLIERDYYNRPLP